MLVQQHGLLVLGWLCTAIANNIEINIIDPEYFLAWVGAGSNISGLKAFFALDLPGVAATWTRLIHLSRDLKSGSAFQTLVEVGFATHNGEWIYQHARTLLGSAVKLGSREAGKIASWMLSQERIRMALPRNLADLFWQNTGELDVQMASEFVRAGVKLERGHLRYGQMAYERVLDAIARFLRPSATRRKRIGLLKESGIDLDSCICPDWVNDDVVRGFDLWWEPKLGDEKRHGIVTALSISDHLWHSGEHDIYEAIITDSTVAKTEISIPGLILAARSGTTQLRLYLDSRPAGRQFLAQLTWDSEQARCYMSRKGLLEAALSVAAGLGDVAAIASFREAGVDPNARMLLSDAKPYGRDGRDWHPLLRTAGGKHLDAVRMLIAMGAELVSDIDSFNPLSVAIWTPRLLADTKRLEQLETVKYFLSILSKDLICAYGVDAMMIAALPATHSHSGSPDEEVIDMLLNAGVELNRRMADGSSLLHITIQMDGNPKTVNVLLPPPQTKLQTAVRRWSVDGLQIIERLLRSKAGCMKEWNAHTILDLKVILPLPEYLTSEDLNCARSFLLSLSKESFLGLWLEVASSWTPLLTRLLSYEASDELIHQAIDAGADISTPQDCNRTEYTPLQLVVFKGRLRIAYRLLELDANVNAPASYGGHTVLQAACGPDKDAEIPLGFIQDLLKKGADINACEPSNFNASALHYAVERGSMDIFCFLLDAGANVNALGKSSSSYEKIESVLDTAAAHGRMDMVNILLKRGAQSYKQGKTAYDGAIEYADECAAKCAIYNEIGYTNNKEHAAIAKMIKTFAETGTC